MTRKLLLIPLLSLLFFGCKQDDLTPSWLAIDNFTLITNEVTQGSNSHGIEDAWIFMDGVALGVFELPCKIPVLDKGEHNFTIFPGVRERGANSLRIKYPFYDSYITTGTLALNDTLHITPTTKYKSDCSFPFIEDFEDPGISFVKGPTSDTDFVFINDESVVKYGDKCGGIFLNSIDSVFTASTASYLELPKAQDVFLEVDYRNNNSIVMGVITRYPDGSVNEHTPYVGFNPQTEGEEVWKKIYINLKEDVSFYANSSSHEIFFLSALDPEIENAQIYIDNIKIVHF